MSTSSQVEILIFLILLKFKIIMENDTFPRKTIIDQLLVFFNEKCQYALIVDALVTVDLIIRDSGT